jgi:signal transduction histidine kinase
MKRNTIKADESATLTNGQRSKGEHGQSIVKQIIETHQGQVWAESELDKGSCFRFRLPAWDLAGRDGQDFMGVAT